MINNERSNEEKIKIAISTLVVGQVFNSYIALCNYLGIERKSGNSKIAQLAVIYRYFSWVNPEGSNKYIITEVFDATRPKIDKKFLDSNLYINCGFLLLKHLADKFNKLGNKKLYYIGKCSIMNIMYICNENYRNASPDFIKEISKTNGESAIFIKEAETHIFKEADRTLKSLRSRGFLNYDEVYMIENDNVTRREATEKEANKINESYAFVKNTYSLNKNTIRFSSRQEKIYKEMEEQLGFRHFTVIKFYLTSDLGSNAAYLKNKANLSESCGHKVNSLICIKISSLVLKKIVKIRTDEIKKITDEKNEIERFKELGEEEYTKQFLNTKIEEHLSTKFKIIYNINSDNNTVKDRIEKLINQFIRIHPF